MVFAPIGVHSTSSSLLEWLRFLSSVEPVEHTGVVELGATWLVEVEEASAIKRTISDVMHGGPLGIKVVCGSEAALATVQYVHDEEIPRLSDAPEPVSITERSLS